jgi:uncharacterized membrane protein
VSNRRDPRPGCFSLVGFGHLDSEAGGTDQAPERPDEETTMTTQVSTSVMVNVPVSRAYNQWTQFEDFPRFMGGVKSVTQLSDDRLEWVAEIAGVKRQWEATILEQVPDRKVAWAATEGATNAGSVTFEDLGGGQTSVSLFLEYEPEGLVEKAGDALNVIERQAEGDLVRFKEFIESEEYATGAWRGSVESEGHVGTPGVESAAASRGDDGKAGVSGKAVAAGVGVAVAAAAAAVVGSKGRSDDDGPDAEANVPEASVAQVADGPAPRMLTDDEIEAGASDVPLAASHTIPAPSTTDRD